MEWFIAETAWGEIRLEGVHFDTFLVVIRSNRIAREFVRDRLPALEHDLWGKQEVNNREFSLQTHHSELKQRLEESLFSIAAGEQATEIGNSADDVVEFVERYVTEKFSEIAQAHPEVLLDSAEMYELGKQRAKVQAKASHYALNRQHGEAERVVEREQTQITQKIEEADAALRELIEGFVSLMREASISNIRKVEDLGLPFLGDLLKRQ